MFDEYVQRINAGEPFDRQDLFTHYPDVASKIADDLELFAALESDSNADDHPLPRLGDYTLRRQIGRGGMGTVYDAWQNSMDRRVALKVLPRALTADTRAASRFIREAQIAGKLDHPNVVHVHATGVDEQVPYYAMELVEGETLAQILARIKDAEPETETPFGPKDQVDYFAKLARAFADVADGLQHAHSKGVIHRDIKPSNLILDESGRLRILDFGLARLEGQESLTLTGDFVGTPLYMSPEQARRKKIPVDHRTDVYSLGATTYEAICGRPPFRGKDHADTLSQIIDRDPVEPSKLNPRVPKDLETIVLKCLRKDSGDRFGTAEALGQDLRRFVRGDPVEARARSMWEVTAKRLWKQRRIAFAVGTLLIFALAGLSVSNAIITKARNRAWYDLYVSNVRLAGEDWRAGNYLRFVQLVEDTASPEYDDIRDWEWFYLEGLRDQELHTLVGHAAGVSSVAWRSGRERLLLATGSADGTVRVWDVTEERTVRQFEYGSPVETIAWSPDGAQLAAAGEQGAVTIWKIDSPEEQRTFGGEPSGTRALAWSWDGQLLASGEVSGRVTIWDAHTGTSREIRDDSHLKKSAVFSLDFSRDGTWLAAGVRGWHVASVLVWDTATWDEPRQLADVLSAIAVSWSPDGRSLAMGNWAHDFRVWNAETWEESARLFRHSGSVHTVAWSADGNWLASGALEITIWNTSTWKPLHTLRGHAGPVASVSWHPDGRMIASGSSDGIVKVWDPFREQNAIAVPGSARATISPDGRWLATKGLREDDETGELLQVFDAATRKVVRTGSFRPETNHYSLSFSPDGSLLATGRARGYRDQHLSVWNWYDDRDVFVLKTQGVVRCIAWSPDGQLLAIGGKGEARILNAANGDLVRTCAAAEPMLPSAGSERSGAYEEEDFPNRFVAESVQTPKVIGVAWNRDGSRFAAARLGIWETAGWRRVAPSPPGNWRWLAWSPDGERLALASHGGAIAVCDESGHILEQTQGHASLIRSIAWSPDGRRLASGAHDRTVRIWDSENLRELLILRGHTEDVLTVNWHPSGSWLVSAAPDGVRIWEAVGYELAGDPK